MVRNIRMVCRVGTVITPGTPEESTMTAIPSAAQNAADLAARGAAGRDLHEYLAYTPGVVNADHLSSYAVRYAFADGSACVVDTHGAPTAAPTVTVEDEDGPEDPWNEDPAYLRHLASDPRCPADDREELLAAAGRLEARLEEEALDERAGGWSAEDERAEFGGFLRGL
jgi:hypothetical protein